jgi:hypothetical protein
MKVLLIQEWEKYFRAFIVIFTAVYSLKAGQMWNN